MRKSKRIISLVVALLLIALYGGTAFAEVVGYSMGIDRYPHEPDSISGKVAITTGINASIPREGILASVRTAVYDSYGARHYLNYYDYTDKQMDSVFVHTYQSYYNRNEIELRDGIYSIESVTYSANQYPHTFNFKFDIRPISAIPERINLRSRSIEDGKVELSWDRFEGASHYQIYISNTSHFDEKNSRIFYSGQNSYIIEDDLSRTYPELYVCVVAIEDAYFRAARSQELEVKMYQDEPVFFKDANLEKCVREQVYKPEGQLYISDIINISTLNAPYKGISSLQGIENLSNLSSLYLQNNSITDIAPLKGLTKLVNLDLISNHICDVTPLKDLDKLWYLNLIDNNISNGDALNGLKNLRILKLSENGLSDIDFLEKLCNLQQLSLSCNQITNIDVLGKLTNLRMVDLCRNQIKDVSSLSSLKNLEFLNIYINQITDISALRTLKGLRFLDLSLNQINDVESLNSLSLLESLDLRSNRISSIEPLSMLKNLRYLYLSGNLIIDFSPLKDLYDNLFEKDFVINPDYQLSGYIRPDFTFSDTAAPFVMGRFKVSIVELGLSTYTDTKGYFQFADIPESKMEYTLKITKPNYLAMEFKTSVTSDVYLSTPDEPLKIWAGDIEADGVQDQAINMSDVMKVATAFGSIPSDKRFVPDLDFNKDNAINMEDIMIIAKHFNKTTNDYFPTAVNTSQLKAGDYVQFGKYKGQPILWRVINHGQEGIMLLSENILCQKAFDSPEGMSPSIDLPANDPRRLYGSNCWDNSNLREWLNSDEKIVSYTTQPPVYESVYGTVYDMEPGFLTNFTISEVEKILPVAHGKVVDKVYLLSTDELTYLNNQLYRESADGTLKDYWLRTPNHSLYSLSGVVYGQYTEYYRFAVSTSGVLPALNIKDGITISGGAGRRYVPYTLLE